MTRIVKTVSIDLEELNIAKANGLPGLSSWVNDRLKQFNAQKELKTLRCANCTTIAAVSAVDKWGRKCPTCGCDRWQEINGRIDSPAVI